MSNTIENEVKALNRRGTFAKAGRTQGSYREEATRLASQRRFVQYELVSGQETASHEKALDDIRQLLSWYGQKRVYLWDPYLSAEDILDTLFYCPHANSELRALTAKYQPPLASRARPTLSSILRQLQEWLTNCLKLSAPIPSFAQRQQAVLADAKSNLRSLRLEYRMKTGAGRMAFLINFSFFLKHEKDHSRGHWGRPSTASVGSITSCKRSMMRGWWQTPSTSYGGLLINRNS